MLVHHVKEAHVAGAIPMALALILMGSILGYLLGVMGIGIRRQVRGSGARPIKHFSLSIVLAILFFGSWAGQGIAQYQAFNDEQQQHGEQVSAGDFVAAFSSTTLENWQSEFLQLFSFVVLSAVLIHRAAPSRRTATTGWNRPCTASRRLWARSLRTPASMTSLRSHGRNCPLEIWSVRGQ